MSRDTGALRTGLAGTKDCVAWFSNSIIDVMIPASSQSLGAFDTRRLDCSSRP